MMKLTFKLLTVLVLLTGMTNMLQAGTVLYDDFEDGVLDTNMWIGLTGTDGTNTSSLLESDGELGINCASNGVRAYLVTQGQWNPADGALTISGTVNMSEEGAFKIWTRASDSFDSARKPSGTGVLADGIVSELWLGGNASSCLAIREKTDTVWAWTDIHSSTTAPELSGGTITQWDFLVVDDGATVTTTWTEVGNPSNVGVSQASSTFSKADTYHIGFGTSWACEISEVTISQVTAVPEPSTVAMLFALAGIGLVLRRRHR